MAIRSLNPLEGAIRHYFVDEAGDGTLFDARGRILVGRNGCSSFFILGMLDVQDPSRLGGEMEALRHRLLADPYFRGVPSMQPEQRKTAIAFHAKDDVQEVRREVLALLATQEVTFSAVVDYKQRVLDYVRQRNERDSKYRYHPNELYDHLVRRLFKQQLHKDDAYRITFARRGRSDRTGALKQAIETARRRFCDQRGLSASASIEVVPANSADSPPLQATDYLLWALQRVYERREDRFFSLLSGRVGVIHDLGDTRNAPYVRYYSKRNVLTASTLAEKPRI
jgi:hypothetical protein